jgi:glycosyltransferase involved in cell wall biosynthesis
MRILWVVPRFGEAVVGGAETLVRALATHATPDSWRAEVATTCAVDHETWENVLPTGTTTEAGIAVHRFPVGARNPSRYEQLHPLILNGTARYGEQVEWLAQSVWSPDLDVFLDEHGPEYDLVLLSPYLFGVTVWGVFVHPERSALVPCLHDEGYARLEPIRQAFETARGCIFNTGAEARLAANLYNLRAAAEVGMGFDPPAAPPRAKFAEARGLGDFVLYAGRLELGKRVDVAAEYAVQYAAERSDAPRLVLAGRGSYRAPEWARDVVFEAGALEGEERRAVRAEALALVVPSVLESLSIVLLETWLERTPALVAGDSPVLKEHCQASGGGFTFDTYEEYRDGLDRLREDPALRSRMGETGRTYVAEKYNWPAVRERFASAVELFAAR